MKKKQMKMNERKNITANNQACRHSLDIYVFVKVSKYMTYLIIIWLLFCGIFLSHGHQRLFHIVGAKLQYIFIAFTASNTQGCHIFQWKSSFLLQNENVTIDNSNHAIIWFQCIHHINDHAYICNIFPISNQQKVAY